MRHCRSASAVRSAAKGRGSSEITRVPARDIRQVYHAIGRDGEASGSVELDLNLRGQGQSLQAIAATADGHLGLAVVGAAVDNRVLSLGLLGELLRGVNQGDVLARRGTTQVRCLAIRLDAKSGIGDVRALLLDSSTLLLEGSGSVNLRDEGLALRLRAQPRLLGLGLTLPLHVSGNFAAPRTVLDAGGTAGIAGSGLGAVGGILGLGGGAGGGNTAAQPDACATQLTIARGGRVGTTPAALPGQDGGSAGGQRGPGGEPGGNQGGNRPRQNPLQRLLPR